MGIRHVGLRPRSRGAALVLVALVAGVLGAGFLAVGGPTSSGADGSSTESAVAARLRATELDRLAALVDADTATVRRLTASDFQLINPAGGELTLDDYLGAIDAGAIDYQVFSPTSPLAVRVSGASAVLRYQVSFDLVVGGDTRVVHQGWITELYELRRGQWQVVWEQATAVPNDLDLFIRSIQPA
jgi:hypothetical protein